VLFEAERFRLVRGIGSTAGLRLTTGRWSPQMEMFLTIDVTS
jgi:hypothetical protein